jgi:putative transposase
MSEKTIIKAYKYRIYPKKSQIKKMEAWLKLCAVMYNFFIDITEIIYKNHNKQINMYDMTSLIPPIRKKSEAFKSVYSTLFYDVAARVSKRYDAFFRRWRNGTKNNRPPKKANVDKYSSFTYPSAKQGLKIKDGRLWLSKIGEMKIVMHRPPEGRIKNCTIKKYPTGKWFAIFVCEVPAPEQRKGNNIVGVDLGINSFAVLSDGTEIANQRFFISCQKRLAKAQRKMSKSKKETPEYEKWRKIAAGIRCKSINRRNDFFHKLINDITAKYDVIAVEDLRIKDMLKNHKLANSITDASWRTFIRMLESKAASKGVKVIKVDPANTSKTCSSCGTVTDIKLGEDTFKCPVCGLILGRDHNAALNIKRLAAQSLGDIPEGPKGNADVHQLYQQAVDKPPEERKHERNQEKIVKNQPKRTKETSRKLPVNEKAARQLILYIISNCKEKTMLTKKTLRNLIYLCDVEYYKHYDKTITESEYKKTEFGPLSLKVCSVITALQKSGTIKENFYVSAGKLIKFYTSSVVSDTSIFSPDQKRVIDQVITEFSYLDEETIRKFVEKDELFASANPRKKINILLTNYRKEDIMSLTGG